MENITSKYIGASTDIPAGDIGVTSREIGWLFGTFKAETSLWEGCLTGKGRAFGGSFMKPEATGYGLIYVRSQLIWLGQLLISVVRWPYNPIRLTRQGDF